MFITPEDKVWIVTDGKPGMENQCLGLAEALNYSPIIKRIVPRFPWSVLPPHLWIKPLMAPGANGDQLVPPWPDIIISTGRQTVAPALAIKKANMGKTLCIQIQNPTVWQDLFDILVIPAHDRVVGDNVINTAGALNRVTKEKLIAESERLRAALEFLPRPLVSVLVGGSNRQYRLTRTSAQSLAENLLALNKTHGAGLAVTASRRTGPEIEATLRSTLAKCPMWFWDGTGENPYFALLGLADAIVVTADSVSMVSEACATGKPVYIAQLEGGSSKFELFHKNLQSAGITRPFNGELENWYYNPLNDTAKVAEEIKRRFS